MRASTWAGVAAMLAAAAGLAMFALWSLLAAFDDRLDPL